LANQNRLGKVASPPDGVGCPFFQFGATFSG